MTLSAAHRRDRNDTTDAATEQAESVDELVDIAARREAAAIDESAGSADSARSPAAAFRDPKRADAATPPDGSSPEAVPQTRRSMRWFLPQLAAFVLVVTALYLAKPLLLPVLIAVLLALLLRPAVVGLRRLRIPEPLGAALVIMLLVSLVAAALTQLYGPAQRWTTMSDADLATIREKLEQIRRPVEAVQKATEQMTGSNRGPGGAARQREVFVERPSLMGAIGQTQAFLVSATSCMILLYFLLASGDMFLRKLVRVLPRLRDKIRAVEISRTIQSDIGHYFATITAVNIGLGTMTALVMSAIGLPNPVLFGVLVGVFNFIPYVGPLASLTVLTLASVLSFETWQQILMVPFAFGAITLIEGNLVQPLVVGKRLSINPVVIFLSVMTWGSLWGIGGIFVAVPVLVVLKICADYVPSMAAVGEFIDND